MAVQRALTTDAGFKLTHVRSAAEALDTLRAGRFDVLLLDYRLPDSTGVDLCRKIRSAKNNSFVVLLTALKQDRVLERALEAGVNDYFIKEGDYGEALANELRHRLGVAS